MRLLGKSLLVLLIYTLAAGKALACAGDSGYPRLLLAPRQYKFIVAYSF